MSTTVSDPATTAARDALWYVGLPLHQVAGDPDVPEQWLLNIGCHDQETFFALASRPVRSQALTRCLVSLAMGSPFAMPDRRNEAIATVLAFTDLSRQQTAKLARSVTAISPRADLAVAALLANPAHLDSDVASAIARLSWAVGRSAAMNAAGHTAAAHGSLGAVAVLLTGGPVSTNYGRHMKDVLATLSLLEGACGSDLRLRRVVVAMGTDWSGTMDELVCAARAVLA